MLTKKISMFCISELLPNGKSLLLSAIIILSLASFYNLNAQDEIIIIDDGQASPGEVIFYDGNFNGTLLRYSLARGETEEPQLSSSWNDKIRSIRVGKGVHLTIYSDKGYESQSVDLYPGDYFILPCGWDQAISSFKLEKIDENIPIIGLIFLDNRVASSGIIQYVSLGEYEQRINNSDRDNGQQGLFCNDLLHTVNIPQDGLRVTITDNADGGGKKTVLTKKGDHSMDSYSLFPYASWVKVERVGWEVYGSDVKTVSSIKQPSESIASDSTGRNNTGRTQEMEVAISTEYGQEYTSKWENSTLIGVEIQTEAGIPGIGKGSVTGKVENTFTIGQEKTGKVTKKFEYKQKTYVAAGKETYGTIIVTPKLVTYRITHKLRNKANPKETREEVQIIVVKDASEAKFQWDDREETEEVTNLALNKTTRQSSDYSNAFPASRAVDGIMTGTGEDFTHTRDEVQSWWEVDLGEVHDISKIVIWNRTDECCWSRLQYFFVMVSETPISYNTREDATLFSGPHSFTDANQRSMTIEGSKRGRYVRIFLINEKNPLSLAEVQIFGK